MAAPQYPALSKEAIELQADGLMPDCAAALRARDWGKAITHACHANPDERWRAMYAILQLAQEAPPRNELAHSLLQNGRVIVFSVPARLQDDLVRTLTETLAPLTQDEVDWMHSFLYNRPEQARLLLVRNLIPSREAIALADEFMRTASGQVVTEAAKLRAAFIAIHEARELQEAMALERPAREAAPPALVGGL